VSLCLEANSAPNLHWLDYLDAHVLSLPKCGLQDFLLRKPFVHLHTQFNAEIPWSEIDMDFMNLNQSAHGDREFGFIGSRLRLNRKVVVGHWGDEMCINRWKSGRAQPAPGTTGRGMKIARFGDNMRDVAVTEGDKVEAQIQLGYRCLWIWRW
jgi:L-arabinose isomerase